MIVNQGNLDGLFRGFDTSFNNGFTGAPSNYADVAMVAGSNTGEMTYAWLGQMPGMREWVGDRIVKNIAGHGWTIKNKKYETTIEVPRESIEDDTYGVFGPLMTEVGRSAGEHPDQLIFPLLNSGFTALCYDGQPFFSESHPVTDAAGAETTVSNMVAGEGPAWFLLDTSRAVRPVIFQKRIDYTFQQLNQEHDVNVFMRDQYLYGVRARLNAGFGLWQLAYGSTAPLNAAAYAAAREAMHAITGDEGRPLGIRPDTLIVPTALEAAGLTILNADRDAAGATNIWAGTAKLIVTPWLN